MRKEDLKVCAALLAFSLFIFLSMMPAPAQAQNTCTNPQSRPYGTCGGIGDCYHLIAGGSYPFTSACGGNDRCLGVGAPHWHGPGIAPFREHIAACVWYNRPCGMSYDCVEYVWFLWWIIGSTGCNGPDCTMYFYGSCAC